MVVSLVNQTMALSRDPFTFFLLELPQPLSQLSGRGVPMCVVAMRKLVSKKPSKLLPLVPNLLFGTELLALFWHSLAEFWHVIGCLIV